MEGSLVRRAYDFAKEKHDGQMYGNRPYMYHLENVVELVDEMYYHDPLLITLTAIAYLHDVMEDCGVTYNELAQEFGICIAEAVKAITKDKSQSYEDYMKQVIGNSLARKVKVCDTLTNMLHSFLENREKGMRKYPHQLVILERGYV